MNILKFLIGAAGHLKNYYGKIEKALKSPKLLKKIRALNKAHRDKIIKIELLIRNIKRDATAIIGEVIVLAASEEGQALAEELTWLGEELETEITELNQETKTVFDFIMDKKEEEEEVLKARKKYKKKT